MTDVLAGDRPDFIPAASDNAAGPVPSNDEPGLMQSYRDFVPAGEDTTGAILPSDARPDFIPEKSETQKVIDTGAFDCDLCGYKPQKTAKDPASAYRMHLARQHSSIALGKRQKMVAMRIQKAKAEA